MSFAYSPARSIDFELECLANGGHQIPFRSWFWNLAASSETMFSNLIRRSISLAWSLRSVSSPSSSPSVSLSSGARMKRNRMRTVAFCLRQNYLIVLFIDSRWEIFVVARVWVLGTEPLAIIASREETYTLNVTIGLVSSSCHDALNFYARVRNMPWIALRVMHVSHCSCVPYTCHGLRACQTYVVAWVRTNSEWKTWQTKLLLVLFTHTLFILISFPINHD